MFPLQLLPVAGSLNNSTCPNSYSINLIYLFLTFKKLQSLQFKHVHLKIKKETCSDNNNSVYKAFQKIYWLLALWVVYSTIKCKEMEATLVKIKENVEIFMAPTLKTNAFQEFKTNFIFVDK